MKLQITKKIKYKREEIIVCRLIQKTNYIYIMKTSIKFIVFSLLVACFLISCHSKKQVFHSMNTPVSIMPMPLKLVDTTYTKTFIQLQPLRHAVALRKVDYYQQAYDELKAMLEGNKEPDFERAVFISENPYYGGRFSYSAFQNSISAKQMFIEKLIEANDQSDTIDFNVHVNENGRFKLVDIRYLPHQKKELYRKALSNWAIFKYITDTVFIHTIKDSTLYTLYHAPYSYATADPFGMKNWSNSQVINLLVSDGNKGNCFALTALYKILSNRLNTDAKICTAPQHIYIQHQDPKGQYYNVELATAGHPGDGIIQTLTYTPSEAIMSGIALRDYNAKQSIGLCLINLAKSYEHTFNTKDDEFMLRCAELALKHDSLNLNALLLKAQVLDVRVTQYANTHKINNIAKLKQDKGIVPLVNKLENHLTLLYRLGYREMPIDMQEQIMNPFAYDTKKWNHISQNARPFTSFEPKDPKDAEYWTLTKGMFKEVWEPTAQEKYGHYTLTTATGKLKSIDTTNSKGQLIDPVAFAYDFGARIYDARVGRFLSVDPLTKEYPELTPYQFAGNMPIWAIDLDGLEPAIKLPDGTYTTARDGQLTGARISPEAIKYYKTLTPPEDQRPDPDSDPSSYFPFFGDMSDFNSGVKDWKNGNKLSSVLSFGSLIPGGDFIFKPIKIMVKNADAIKSLVKYSGFIGREAVIITKTGSRTDAKKVVDGILGDLGDKMKAVEGRVKNQQGRITGLESADKSKGWRLDWDDKKKEGHYNYWNNETGEKGRVLFEGTKEQVESLIDQLTKTYDAPKR